MSLSLCMSVSMSISMSVSKSFSISMSCPWPCPYPCTVHVFVNVCVDVQFQDRSPNMNLKKFPTLTYRRGHCFNGEWKSLYRMEEAWCKWSHSICAMQKRSVCCRNVPCLAHIEQGPDSSTLSTHPPSYLPGYWGLSLLQPSTRMDLDSGVDTCKQPNLEPVGAGKCMWYCLLFPSRILSFGVVPYITVEAA